MNHKSTYELSVRGETVRIEFTRINDSRRLKSYHYGTNKNPNLFKVRAAMGCRVSIPVVFCPEWAQKHTGNTFPFNGVSLCFRPDPWNIQKGRHVALAEALDYPQHDDMLNAQIVAAFTAEEKRRTKTKGPDRKPKTATPKAPRPSMRQIMTQVRDLLQQMAYPMFVYNKTLTMEDLDLFTPGPVVTRTLDHNTKENA